MNNYLKISELIWLASAIICVGVVAWIFATEGFTGNYYLLFLPGMAGAVWFLRRKRRIQFEKEDAARKEQEKK